MREIKFRAWDKSEKIMDTPFHVGNVYPGSSIESIFGDENIIFMQYTGLKDKNGKEVFEGDIIEWETSPMAADPEKCRMPVERLQSGMYVPHLNNTSVVIGNIYENPELLETK